MLGVRISVLGYLGLNALIIIGLWFVPGLDIRKNRISHGKIRKALFLVRDLGYGRTQSGVYSHQTTAFRQLIGLS